MVEGESVEWVSAVVVGVVEQVDALDAMDEPAEGEHPW